MPDNSFMRTLLIALLFISCNNRPQNVSLSIYDSGAPPISTEKLDTVKAIPYSVTTPPAIFETAYFTGTKAMQGNDSFYLYGVDIGSIKIESGEIIAGDPIIIQDAKPFVQKFPIGEFPVQLSIAKFNDDERVAFSRILFSDSPVVKWEFALHEGQEQKPIDSGAFYGYGVDAGTGMFIDKKARDAFQLRYKPGDVYTEVFINEMNKHYRHTWQYVLYEFDTYNLASFSTGYGDGSYGTYVGYDSKGNICRLLTDFGLVEWWTK
jgi:hypothetical protein